MGTYGVPTTEAEKAYYVKQICLGLVNLSNSWDKLEDVIPYAVKFADTGIWSDSKDIEVTAHMIVSNAMRIHKFGVTGAAFRRSEQFESLNAEDMDFTFPQRIHYLARLFWHSKVAADTVMLGRDADKYIALPLTSLRTLLPFEEEWSGMSNVERMIQTEILPYPPGLKHPSRAEQDRLASHVRTLPSLVHNYMATGDPLSTFTLQHCSPSASAASRKRSADRDEESEMSLVSKRFREDANAWFADSFVDLQIGGGSRSSHMVDD